MSTARKLLVLALGFGSVGCDQATKAMARESLAAHPPLSYLGGIVRLQYAENSGAFLSLGADLPPASRFWLFTVVGAGILVGLFVLAFRGRAGLSLAEQIAFAVLVGGAASNLIDRIANDGAVVDFLNLGIGRLRTGIFNVADVAIVLGCVILAFSLGRAEPRSTERP